MLCHISGEVPREPVASKKSGAVFERSLIEAYIAEQGTDPASGEPLTKDDLIVLNTGRIARPRPPTLTSVPALLSAFQTEWDALALQSYSLKTELLRTRQELSTALYQHDAAVRVIARLIRERNEAREALSKVSRNGSDSLTAELPAKYAEAVAAKHEELQSTRRKRPVPEDWATAQSVSALSRPSEPIDLGVSGPGTRLALSDCGEKVLAGTNTGMIVVYNLATKQSHQFSSSKGAVTDGFWHKSELVVSFATGEVMLFDEQGREEVLLGKHANGATALALHPCGDLAASVGGDGAYNVYDLTARKLVARLDTEAKSALSTVCFHPDGHLIAVSSNEHAIPIFDFATGAPAARFETDGPVDRLDFSENGVWLAVVVRNQSVVSIWDLRKGTVFKTLDVGVAVLGLRFDYTGQFLAVGGPSGLVVYQSQKSAKSNWPALLETAVDAADIVWTPRAQQLVVRTVSGGLAVLS